MHPANHSSAGEANEKLHPVSRNRVRRSECHVLYGSQRGREWAELGKQFVFGESLTFTLPGSAAIGFCGGRLGGTLARDGVCVSNTRLSDTSIGACAFVNCSGQRLGEANDLCLDKRAYHRRHRRTDILFDR
jgi:hypothetical protein